MPGRKSFGGWPVWEIALAACIAAVILGVLRQRYEFLLEQAEASAVRLQLMQLGSALRLQQAQRVAAGQGWGDLVRSNPLDWLDTTLGEKKRKDLKPEMTNPVKAGKWQYAADLAAVRYCPLRRQHLEAGGAECLVWQVQGGGVGEGLRLVGLTPYKWF